MTKWIVVLGLIFLADLTTEFQDDWFPNAANALFAVQVAFVFFGAIFILRERGSEGKPADKPVE
jgi:hypothetical protein